MVGRCSEPRSGRAAPWPDALPLCSAAKLFVRKPALQKERRPRTRLPRASRLFELLADRQGADALAGGGEDRVDQRRRKRRNAGFADAARRRVGAGRHDEDVGDRRRLVDPDHREVVEIALLYLAVLEADLAVFGEAQPHDRSAFDLRVDPLRIDVSAAIDRGIDPGHRELALVVDRHLDDGRDVAD
ncbi:hypothetical protein chiPu_0031621, partial [Chiloscyllium punctatum]|nr:hypothetical protein [Chiloscyllium punctatum]